MSDVRLLLTLTLVPALAALATAAWARRLAARSPRAADALAGLGLAAGFALALYLAGTRPSLPLAVSDDAWTWVVWIAPAGAVLGLALLAPRLPEASTLVVRLAFGTGAMWLIVRPLVPHALSPGEALARGAAWGAGATLLTTVLARHGRGGANAARTLALLVALLGTAFLLLKSGLTLQMAQAGLVLAACVAATAALAGWARVPPLPVTAAPAVATSFVGLLAGAHAYLPGGTDPRFPLSCALLLFAASCCVLVPRWRWGFAAALVLVSGAAALGGPWDGPAY